MVVPAGGVRLTVHLLFLFLLAAKPTLVSMAVTSLWTSDHHGLSSTGNVSDDTIHPEQADMPLQEQFYRGQEDIQVGCRELRAKRYISDGFCTSIKPIKEVVCAGNCLPIRNLPWYAEFVKVWARSKLREWQCEEDVVRRKSVHLLCRNGEYRTYRIKVVKSCKCKRSVDEHNRTELSSSASSSATEGKRRSGKKKDKKRRGGRKDKKRRGKKRRKGEKRRKRPQEDEEPKSEMAIEEEELRKKQTGSQTDQRQEASSGAAEERKGRKKDRETREESGTDTNSDPGRGPAAADATESDRPQALGDPSR